MRSTRIIAPLPALLLSALGLWGPVRADVPNWTQQTVGTSSAGSADVDSSGVWTIKGSGSDLWDRDDEFHIVYQPLSSDGSITTKLLGVDNGDEHSKAGVMMREDLDNTAAKIMTVQMEGGDHGGESRVPAMTDARRGKE